MLDYQLILILFGMSCVTLSVVYLSKFSGRKQKKIVKGIKDENTDEIIKSYENSMTIIKQQNEFLMADAKQTKKKLAAEIGVNLRNREEESTQTEIKITDENLEEYYEIDVTNGIKLVESMKLPFLDNMDKSKIPDLINNPIIKGKVWKYIKENKDEMISLGVIVPKGIVQEKSTKEEVKNDNPDGMLELEFSQKNANHMA